MGQRALNLNTLKFRKNDYQPPIQWLASAPSPVTTWCADIISKMQCDIHSNSHRYGDV